LNGLFGDGFLEQNAEQEFGVAAFDKTELEGFDLVANNFVHGLNKFFLEVFVLGAKFDKMSCDLVTVLEE
jgi:hypothetical protein